MYKFGERLKELRYLRGLTQRELGNILGVTDGAVMLWESNARMPSISVLLKIADYFGVSLDYLIGRTDDPKPPSAPLSLTDGISQEHGDDQEQGIGEPISQLPPWLASLPEDMRKFVIKEAKNGWPFMRLAYGASLNKMKPYELESIIETWVDAKKRYEEAQKSKRNRKKD